jgi:hypothetical protein
MAAPFGQKRKSPRTGSNGLLDRITINWNRYAVPINRVNPIDIKELEQIHMVSRIALAIPTDHDLL